jgi:hypothetical protein
MGVVSFVEKYSPQDNKPGLTMRHYLDLPQIQYESLVHCTRQRLLLLEQIFLKTLIKPWGGSPTAHTAIGELLADGQEK